MPKPTVPEEVDRRFNQSFKSICVTRENDTEYLARLSKFGSIEPYKTDDIKQFLADELLIQLQDIIREVEGMKRLEEGTYTMTQEHYCEDQILEKERKFRNEVLDEVLTLLQQKAEK